jgi:hypothetical protein
VTGMFVIETRDAKRMRKYAILMGVVFFFLGLGGLGALMTMHIWTMPRDQPSRPKLTQA